MSFWYLYDAGKNLTAMILEVNNTFDERRMYLLTPDKTLDLLGADCNGEKKSAAPMRFLQTWPKDFHVSPFNSRKGSYSLSASDPLIHSPSENRSINNTIVLRSSKTHSKMVARLFSEGPVLDPEEMSLSQ